MARILLVDDDHHLLHTMGKLIREEGHDVEFRDRLQDGLKEARENGYDIIFLDVELPDGNGMEYVDRFKNVASNPEIIVFTNEAKAESIEPALKKGAVMYRPKPYSIKELLEPIRELLSVREERQSLQHEYPNIDGIIGSCRLMKDCVKKAYKAAGSDMAVLIRGETGTGKELIAKAIHMLSLRSQCRMITVDCAALNESLASAALFGVKKGAYTDCHEDRKGYLLQAHQGTLFLDEIGDLPLNIQMKFLRVLEGGRFMPVGGENEEESDFRIVAATRRNLEKRVENGVFRQDLFERLKALTIHVPPLRERGDDIRRIIEYYLDRTGKKLNSGKKHIPKHIYELLENYPWPGNVRELKNAINEILISVSDAQRVSFQDIPTAVWAHDLKKCIDENTEEDQPGWKNTTDDTLPPWKTYREEGIRRIEKAYLTKLRELSGKNVKKAMEISGLSKPRLFSLYKKFNITHIEPIK